MNQQDQISELIEIVSKATGVSIPEIKGTKRKSKIVLAKQIYCYLAADLFCLPLRLIAKGLNEHYHHSTVIHSRDKAIRDLKNGYDDITIIYNNAMESLIEKSKGNEKLEWLFKKHELNKNEPK